MKKILNATMIGVTTALLFAGCSSRERSRAEMEAYDAMAANEPGVLTGVWEPPIVDVIEVPPGLDPEGHYYRPSHEEIVEIRQGKWKVEERNKRGR